MFAPPLTSLGVKIKEKISHDLATEKIDYFAKCIAVTIWGSKRVRVTAFARLLSYVRVSVIESCPIAYET